MSRPSVNLHIDTSSSLNVDAPRISVEPHSPRTPSLLPSEKSQSPLSPHTPSLPIPYSPDPEKSPSRLHFGRSSSHNAHKGKLESRKLLAHLLYQLQDREMPPSVFETFRTGPSAPSAPSLGSVVQTVRGAVKLNHGKGDTSVVEDEDDTAIPAHETDATLDLLNQLKEVLLISISSGWQIFYDSSEPLHEDRQNSIGRSPFRLRRQSGQSPRRSSRSASPNPTGEMRAPELLSQCISVLGSIILHDCRFRSSSPRFTRPRNSLQFAALDIAQFLVFNHRHEPKIISRIVSAMIPAFETFPYTMHFHLLNFFDQVVMGGVLEELRYAQGATSVSSLTTQAPQVQNPENENSPPFISIQVEEAPDEAQETVIDRRKPWLSQISWDMMATKSTNAPLQPIPIYHLSSLVTPFIATALENLDLSSLELPLLRFHQVFRNIMNLKPDVYLNLLEVVAYHTTKARRAAVNMLFTFYPKALGHTIITKPLRIFNTSSSLEEVENHHHGHGGHPISQRHSHQLPGESVAHNFVPWHFDSHSTPVSYQDMLSRDCHACSASISGFGLLCTLCLITVHLDCYDYPDGFRSFEYAFEMDPNVKKVVVERFCYTYPSRHDVTPKYRKTKHGHQLRPVNSFNLSLCATCHLPLWGTFAQGLKCSKCHQFSHSACAEGLSSIPCRVEPRNSSDMTIEWESLRQSFLDHYRDVIGLPSITSFEEASILHSVFLTQLALLNHGITVGSVIVKHGSAGIFRKTEEIKEFELHSLAQHYGSQLSSNSLLMSESTQDYIEQNNLTPQQLSIVNDWSMLVYIVTIVKSPIESNQERPVSSASLLTVAPLEAAETEEQAHPYEVVSLAHIRDSLALNLGIQSDVIARILFHHLHHMGLFERSDRCQTLLTSTPQEPGIRCIFPLPFGLDVSTDVETLMSAFEACITELDISLNEVGFLLLARRLWPNGIVSDYAVKRIFRALLHWVIDEDRILEVLIRDYISHGKDLPGIRHRTDHPMWPHGVLKTDKQTRNATGTSGDYIGSRHALLNHYVVPWLRVLHKQMDGNYSQMVYELVSDMAEDNLTVNMHPESRPSDLHFDSAFLNEILKLLVKVFQSSLCFSAVDDIVLRWLNDTSRLGVTDQSMSSVNKLFSRDPEPMSRSSSLGEGVGSFETSAFVVPSPWDIIVNTANLGTEAIIQAFEWTQLLARSGVDVPMKTYAQLFTLAIQMNVPLVFGRDSLQANIADLHQHLATSIINALKHQDTYSEAFLLLRLSLATCLLIYGCDRQAIIAAGLIEESEVKGLTSRRRMTTRVSMISDPVIVHSKLMAALHRYLGAGSDEIVVLIGSFVSILINQTRLLESHEIDNFILRNGEVLCSCAWRLYEIQRHDISEMRISLLIRILVIDAQSFNDLLGNLFRKEGPWEQRMFAVARLFRIILDVTSPVFRLEDRQWRSNVTSIFEMYFSSFWKDEREEIRLSVGSWSQTLRPAHLEVITACWDEKMTKGSVLERIQLVNFLIQLQPHFPTWQIISWGALMEILLEDDYMRKNADDDPASAHFSMYGLSSKHHKDKVHLDPNLPLLRVGIITLSLKLLANGHHIDLYSLMKIKEHLVDTIGFEDVKTNNTGTVIHVHFSHIEDVSETAYPCLLNLPAVLDASRTFELPPNAMRTQDQGDIPCPVLVGSAFVDVALHLFTSMPKLSYLPDLVMKSLLDSIIAIIYKHDLESKALKHLGHSLRRAANHALELSREEVSYEVRQLAVTVSLSYVKRFPAPKPDFISDCIQETIKLIASLKHSDEDMLVGYARNLLETCLIMHSHHGVLLSLFKRQLDDDIFIALKQVTDMNSKILDENITSLRDDLLQDLFHRSAEIRPEDAQTIVKNLNSYLSNVQTYLGENLMQSASNFLVDISPRWATLSYDQFDPNPLISTFTVLLVHNKQHQRLLTTAMETVLRLSLARFDVDSKTLEGLLRLTSSIHRRMRHNRDKAQALNGVDEILFESVSAALLSRSRTTPKTLIALIETVTSTEMYKARTANVPQAFSQYFDRMITEGFMYLEQHAWSDAFSENNMNAALVVAKMLLEAAGSNKAVLEEAGNAVLLSTRAWNILILEALSSETTSWSDLLLSHFHAFSAVYFTSLRPYMLSGSGVAETAQTSINHAFAAMKLWLLLAVRKRHQEPGTVGATGGEVQEDHISHEIWAVLWPPFESIVNAFEADAMSGGTPGLAHSMWSSVGDLFVYIRQIHSPLVINTASHIALLNRLKKYGRGDGATNKLTKVVQQLQEPLPNQASWDNIIMQVKKDIFVAEKLQALDMKRKESGTSKTVPEVFQALDRRRDYSGGRRIVT